MKVRFFTFSKKYNSTARPSTGYTEYECVIKSSSDVITPTVELQIGLSTNPSSFNYCYIPDYNRYYWVKDWTFYNHLWVATLNVDVLATWKPYIGNTSMYVYRASNEYDGKLLDTKYTTIADVTVSTHHISAVNKKFSEGFFVVGVYGNSTNNTTMAYYVIKGTDFGTFIDQIYTKGIMDDSVWEGHFSLGTFPLAKGIRNAIFDIATYIKSLMWFPYDPSGMNPQVPDIQVGGFTINCPNYKLNDYRAGAFSVPVSGMITIPKHPQTASRGVYCNLKPYSRYKLTYLPFGVFELDSTIIGLYTYLFMNVFVDGITGKATLSVFVSNNNQGSNAVLLLTADAKYGVDIPISVSQTNIPSVASSLAGAGISAIHGNIWSAGVSAISAVAEMASPALVPVSNSQGSVLGVNYQNNQLQCTFYTIADEDNNSNGRPLCKVRTPANLGGYIEGESNEFSAPATVDEMEEIKRFIDNGFYYE